MMPQAADMLPVYALVGADRFLVHDALAGIVASLSKDGDLGPSKFDGPSAELSEVLDELRTFSLLGGRRVALVEDADAFITAHRAALERYCEHPVMEATLILLCHALASNTRLHKIISRTGSVIKCEPLKGRAVIEWAIRRAESHYAKRLPRDAALSLVEHLGDSTGALDAELGKLAAYVGERADISRGDVDTVTGRCREEKVFAVTDAMASGDIAGALRNWEQVVATDRAAPGRAIAGLAWGVRRLLEARRDWDKGVSIVALSKRMFTDPDLLRRRLERVSAVQWEGQQRDLLAADLAVKTGVSTFESAVEAFVIKHSATGPSGTRAVRSA